MSLSLKCLDRVLSFGVLLINPASRLRCSSSSRAWQTFCLHNVPSVFDLLPGLGRRGPVMNVGFDTVVCKFARNILRECGGESTRVDVACCLPEFCVLRAVVLALMGYGLGDEKR